MTDQLFFDAMLAASGSMIVTGLILATIKTRQNERAAKFHLAKYALTVAVITLGLLNLVQISFDPEGDISYLGSCLALAMSYLQAMLFTMAVLVLIRPEEVTLRRVLWQLAAIAVADAALVGTFFLLPQQVFFYVYELMVLLYLVLLAFYTRWYLRCHRQFKAQISAYYEEEEIERSLRWLGLLFWAALAVGLLTLLMVLGNRAVAVGLTLLLALYYAFLAASFINYQLSSTIILPALQKQPAPDPVAPVSTDDPHPDRLVAWIERGGFLETDKAVEVIAQELDMNLAQFHAYFSKVVGEDFRTWRVRKRIEHAQQLLREHPDWTMMRIAQASGFNDRSYFYQQFLRCTGQTVSNYRATLS